MGLLIDTDVWVLAEKAGGQINIGRWAQHGGAYMSAVTAGELLVDVERANTAQRRARRSAFVEYPLANIPVLEFSVAVARTHARMLAAVTKSKTAGAHDALIAATAIHHGHALLTRKVADFRIFPGLKRETFAETT